MNGFLAWQVLGQNALVQIEEAKKYVYIYIYLYVYVYVYLDARMRQACEIHFLVEHASIFCKIFARWRKLWGEEGVAAAGVVGRGWRAGGCLEGSSYFIPDV